LIAAVAVANAVLYHRPLYAFAVANLDWSSPNGILTLATLFFLTAFVTTLIFSLLALISQRLIVPLCMIFALCNAIALYFIDSYGVVLDESMMGNVFNTNLEEASELLHPKLLVYLLPFGALPCWLLARVRIQRTRWLRLAAFSVVILLIGVGWIYASSTTWLWFDKNSRKLGGMTLPWAYVVNASRYQADRLLASRQQKLLPAAGFLSDEKTIVILVIGEAARAQNFSLYGYGRATNPLLAESNIVVLPHARSCATYTTASLLCILSHKDTGWHLSQSDEPLPSYLERHGIDVIWRTNNWGEPALKVGSYERAKDLRNRCQGESCDYDEVLKGLEQRIRSSTREKIFVVLHQRGSHGPAYYERYPKQFEIFKPACHSVELHQCTSEELVNAYDNTILYTDYFLHRAIELLKGFPGTATMLMYVSDHGQSLGEYGLYLHGTPYSIAPDVQKDIPFLVWMSDAFRQAKGIPVNQLAPQSHHSQANVFHSIMGAFDMRSDIYDRQLDIFSGDE
jgi:lipid A ethanolaminephosphotransferase